MAFPNGPLAEYFQTNDDPAPISQRQQRDLFVDTRGLIGPFLGNTDFCQGLLAVAFLQAVPAFTIFSRRNFGNGPYLVSELGSDLRAGTVDRTTIDQATEDTIRAVAAHLKALPPLPLPIIVEDSSGQQYLVLEGNKRFAAAALANSSSRLPPCKALVGRTYLSWPQMLAFFGMVPAQSLSPGASLLP